VAACVCPHCKSELSATNIVAYTNGVDCPKCGARLEVASGARNMATLCGLAVAAIVWRLSSGSSGDLGAVLPTLFAFLSFGIMSALVLMFTANLRNAPVVPISEPAHASAGHGSAGHDGGDHAPVH
jgi:DNA-directed RNA polymerase subunit RPC12/RpoP